MGRESIARVRPTMGGTATQRTETGERCSLTFTVRVRSKKGECRCGAFADMWPVRTTNVTWRPLTQAGRILYKGQNQGGHRKNEDRKRRTVAACSFSTL